MTLARAFAFTEPLTRGAEMAPQAIETAQNAPGIGAPPRLYFALPRSPAYISAALVVLED